MNNPTSNVLKWALIIGIVFVLNLFFNYALSVIYKAPQYDAFCKEAQTVDPISTQQSCTAVGGKWSSNITPDNRNYYCDATYTCRQTFQAADNNYNRNVFITLVVLGVLALVASFLLMRNLVIAYGLAIGGVLSFLVASVRYWSSANDLIKLLILAAALAVLLVLAAKKFTTSK